MRRKPCDSPDRFAIDYLNVVMEEADQEELVAALSRIARLCSRSKVVESRLVEKIELNAQALYRALCRRGNPELKSAMTLLRALGVRLSVQSAARTPYGKADGIAVIRGPTHDLSWSAADVPALCSRRNRTPY